jgi:hypothetical protein
MNKFSDKQKKWHPHHHRNGHHHRGADSKDGLWFFRPGSVESCIAGPGPMKEEFLQDKQVINCYKGLEVKNGNTSSEFPHNQRCPYIGLDGVDLVQNEINCANIENNVTAGLPLDDSITCKPRPAYRNVAGFLKHVGKEIEKAIDDMDEKDKAHVKELMLLAHRDDVEHDVDEHKKEMYHTHAQRKNAMGHVLGFMDKKHKHKHCRGNGKHHHHHHGDKHHDHGGKHHHGHPHDEPEQEHDTEEINSRRLTMDMHMTHMEHMPQMSDNLPQTSALLTLTEPGFEHLNPVLRAEREKMRIKKEIEQRMKPGNNGGVAFREPT